MIGTVRQVYDRLLIARDGMTASLMLYGEQVDVREELEEVEQLIEQIRQRHPGWPTEVPKREAATAQS